MEFLYFDQLKKVIPSNLEEPFKIEGFKDINELKKVKLNKVFEIVSGPTHDKKEMSNNGIYPQDLWK